MDPKEEEPQASTSKRSDDNHDKKSHVSRSRSKVEDDDEEESGSQSCETASGSENSRVEMVKETRARTGGKKERRERKKSRRPHGRIEKRSRRANNKRSPKRRSKRIKDMKRKRQSSMSTVFTKVLSGATSCCSHCGHRCCNRRYSNEMEKERERRIRHMGDRERLKCMATQTAVACSMNSACVQVGSRSVMLSPLCLDISPPDLGLEEHTYHEITPEMIHEAIKRLSMWQENVGTSVILDYIKNRYPVGQGDGLLDELQEKLRIGSIVGMVTQTKEGLWCLSCALINRKITKNHVSLFWKLYGDTMKPVTKKPESPAEDQQETTQENGNNTSSVLNQRSHTEMSWDYI